MAASRPQKARRAMQNAEEWAEQLTEAEGKVSEAYEILAALQRSLRDAGQKKDAQAIGEVVERLARYGRLFQDILASWADPDQ
jgi:DNA repair ATPase RecN